MLSDEKLDKAYLSAYACRDGELPTLHIAGLRAVAYAAVQAEREGAVPVPAHAQQAAAMVLIGHAWLKDNAPHMLTEFGQINPPQASATVPEDADQYYLQESSGFIGNDMVFWRKNGAGYTTDLRDAHVYTLSEATRKQKSRKTDIPWSKSYIDSKARPAVDCQYVSQDDADLFAASQPDADKGGA